VTIFALSSGHGKAGVAVIRISGAATETVLRAMSKLFPAPRHATLATLSNPETGEALDRGLLLWFPAPASFTGEDMAELHIHGGRAVLEALFHVLARFPGLREAQPGEFTRRAFERGKLDLTTAEGLADLIDAETEAQRRQAFRQSNGALQSLYEQWRERLIQALAGIEAELDFSDEEDVPDAVTESARATATALRMAIADHLADGRRGEILREGLHVVIAGPPNAGKSSLMNALVRRDVAIVSTEAGTTRDVIEAHLDLAGYPVILMDTAGIREAHGAIELEGIRRTLDRARKADVIVWLRDGTDFHAPGLEAMEGAYTRTAHVIHVVNKIDLAGENASQVEGALCLSAKTGEGMDALIAQLTEEARSIIGNTDGITITRARHRRELETCLAALDHFLTGDFSALELRAEDLRHAASAIGRLTGRIDVEEVLNHIFAEFCIGK
jgi:tRNA modification GTPase